MQGKQLLGCLHGWLFWEVLRAQVPAVTIQSLLPSVLVGEGEAWRPFGTPSQCYLGGFTQ